MNNREPHEAASQVPDGADGDELDHRTGLPMLSDARVDHIEGALFSEISRDRGVRRIRRGRGWLVAGAAAAVIVVAAVIAPSVGTLVSGTSANEASVLPGTAVPVPTIGGAEQFEVRAEGLDVIDGTSGSGSITAADSPISSTSGRDIITTASATIVVADVPEAARTIGDAATASGGYVESMSVGRSGEVTPVDPAAGGLVYDTVPLTQPYPSITNGAWITVRVPAGELDGLVERLSSIGEVTASSVNRQDVTEQTVDMRARVDAAQASVDRMTELMAQAANLTELIAAESALAERQATLESYQQQLKYYDEQISLSTLTVTLTPPAVAVEANPAGFTDGLAAGWNGLVATLNGIVIAIGFLLPWIVIVAVVVLVVWGIARLVRRRKSVPTSDQPSSSD